MLSEDRRGKAGEEGAAGEVAVEGVLEGEAEAGGGPSLFMTSSTHFIKWSDSARAFSENPKPYTVAFSPS